MPRDCQQKHKVGYLHTKPHEQAQKHVCLHTPKTYKGKRKCKVVFLSLKPQKCKDVVMTNAYTKQGFKALL